MNIDEIKKLLKENVIEFDYVKTDGTKRHAVGTMIASKLPKPTKSYFCTDIKWNGENHTLPTFTKITGVDAELSNDELVAELSDKLIERYGSTPVVFSVQAIERAPKKMKEGHVFYYDLEKKGGRSFLAETFSNPKIVEA